MEHFGKPSCHTVGIDRHLFSAERAQLNVNWRAVKKPILEISLGFSFAMCLLHDGTVLSAGTTGFGKLGRPTKKDEQKVTLLKEIVLKKKVVHISCGGHHALALTSSL